MPAVTGTNVAAPVRPFTTDDVYPTHHANEGLGGWHAVASIEERDAIPAARRQVGMAVRVVGGDIYEWTGAAWVVLPIEGPEGPAGPAGPAGAEGPAGPAGPAGAEGPAGGSFADAPADGTTYGRRDGAWVSVAGGGGADLDSIVVDIDAGAIVLDLSNGTVVHG